MRTVLIALAASAIAFACTSSNSTGSSADAGETRILACAPATDAGVTAALDAGVTAKILLPTDGQRFKTTEKVTLSGTGSAPDESKIVDPQRMIWNVGTAAKGVNPDGEGPDDTSGPYPAGTYIVRFDVSSKACLTAADTVTIVVE